MLYMDTGLRMDSGLFMDEPAAPVKPKPTHMRDLHIWFTNPFDDPHISMAELLAFTSDHLQRMIANPLPALAARVTATQTALGGVSGAFTDDESMLGLRKARKQAKNDYRTALIPRVGAIAIKVQAQFGEGSAEFVECFPHGRTIFSNCPDDEVANNLDILVAGVTAHTPPLAAQIVTDATAIKTGWTAVFSPSESAGGAKTTTIAAKNAARAALQLELFKNLLALATLYPRQPEQLDLYMQQTLLQPHTQTPATPATPPASAPKTP
jgi:hypothetical protein